MPDDTPLQRRHRLARLFDPPAYVKEAADWEFDDQPGEGREFADPGRRYPIHTKAAAWHSAALFADDAPPPSSAAAAVRRKIDEAVARFRIWGDDEAVRAKQAGHAAVDRDALPDDDFALLERNDRGVVVRRSMSILNPRELKAAADRLRGSGLALPFEVRRDVAARILAKAAALGVALDDEDGGFLERTAALGTNTRAAVAEALAKRARLVVDRDPDLADALVRAARDQAERRPGRNPTFVEEHDDLLKLASILDRVDFRPDLGLSYERDGISPPEHELFAVRRSKMAEFLATHVDLAGAFYKRSEVARMDLDEVRRRMGEGFAERCGDGVLVDVEKVAALMADRGADGAIDRANFAKAAAAMGVRPATAAVVEPALDDDALRKIAARLPEAERGPRNLHEI